MSTYTENIKVLKINQYEPLNFRDNLSSLEAPKYPLEINLKLLVYKEEN